MIREGEIDLIHSIQKEDAFAIKSICESMLGHQTSIDHIRQKITELTLSPYYYIAVFEDESDHIVKGFIEAQEYDLLYGERGWNIMALAVSSQAQNNGIGTQLIASLEKYAKKNGDTFIRLNCRSERVDADGFYEHLGYQCDKIQKRFIKYIDDDFN